MLHAAESGDEERERTERGAREENTWTLFPILQFLPSTELLTVELAPMEVPAPTTVSSNTLQDLIRSAFRKKKREREKRGKEREEKKERKKQRKREKERKKEGERKKGDESLEQMNKKLNKEFIHSDLASVTCCSLYTLCRLKLYVVGPSKFTSGAMGNTQRWMISLLTAS